MTVKRLIIAPGAKPLLLSIAGVEADTAELAALLFSSEFPSFPVVAEGFTTTDFSQTSTTTGVTFGGVTEQTISGLPAFATAPFGLMLRGVITSNNRSGYNGSAWVSSGISTGDTVQAAGYYTEAWRGVTGLTNGNRATFACLQRKPDATFNIVTVNKSMYVIFDRDLGSF